MENGKRPETKADPHTQSKERENQLKPNLSFDKFNSKEFKEHVTELTSKGVPKSSVKVLEELLEKVKRIDFRKEAKLGMDDNPKATHFLIISVEKILELARANNWGLCQKYSFKYVYNGSLWTTVSEDEMKMFLGKASEKMGVDQFRARHYKFRENLVKQFDALANLPSPEQPDNSVLINLKNGTFEFNGSETKLRNFEQKDFLSYQLSFDYDPEAKAPLFANYLNRVLPDVQCQKVISEYLGYVFIKHKFLKLEKTLFLFGGGSNGKSVLFDVVNAMLGTNNVSSYSLKSLTDVNGYHRAQLANKLVNYTSEITDGLEADIFKQLTSGEPVEARLPYKDPFILRDYAKLIFNANKLPQNVEHTKAFFRRFLIIPFDVTIPEEEQDKELANKVIANELSGVFNWVIEGLHRILRQKKFSECNAAVNAVKSYEKQSDSVKLYLDEMGYVADSGEYFLIKDLYRDYRSFCCDDGFSPVNKSNFIRRIEQFNIAVERRNVGNVAFLKKLTQF